MSMPCSWEEFEFQNENIEQIEADTIESIAEKITAKNKNYDQAPYIRFVVAIVKQAGLDKDVDYLKSRDCQILMEKAGFDYKSFITSLIAQQNKLSSHEQRWKKRCETIAILRAHAEEIKEKFYVKKIRLMDIARSYHVCSESVSFVLTGIARKPRRVFLNYYKEGVPFDDALELSGLSESQGKSLLKYDKLVFKGRVKVKKERNND